MLGHITDPGAPAGLDRRELPEPRPGAHETLVAVRAYAVNRGELTLLDQRADGWPPGQDVSGEVVEAAADGSGPPAGARVVGPADGGGWSERVAIPSHRLAVLPDAVSFADAAALPVAGLTALRALRTGGPLLGRRVLITGASGGVGSFAVQLAVAAGAHVTALVSSERRVDAARELGAHDVVTSLEGVESFHLVLDGVGGPVLADAVHHLAKEGTVTAYGVAGGRAQTPLAFYDFAQGGGQLGRLIAFFVYATGEETFGEDLAVLAGLVADGRLRVQKGVVRDWSETREAVQALRDREVTGKVVLTVGGAGAAV
jgi:NADPH:quinone reductase-like Zn-dependent oxidoreductase